MRVRWEAQHGGALQEVELLTRASGKMLLLHKLLPKLRAERTAGMAIISCFTVTSSTGAGCPGWYGVRCCCLPCFMGGSWVKLGMTAILLLSLLFAAAVAAWLIQVLIFSQFKMVLADVLEDYLAACHYPCERIDGDTSHRKRQAAIDRFMGQRSGGGRRSSASRGTTPTTAAPGALSTAGAAQAAAEAVPDHDDDDDDQQQQQKVTAREELRRGPASPSPRLRAP